MVNINQVRVAWSGFPGGPGISTFYTTGPLAAFRTSLSDMLTGLSTYIPGNVLMVVETSGSVLDPLSGDLVSVWSEATEHVIDGLDSSAYSAPTGFIINWATGTVLNGHLLRGRTYIVPAGGDVFETDGTIIDTVLESLRVVVDTFVDDVGTTAVVWSRPTTGHAGGFSAITSGDIPDFAAVLRSRRD